jgi:hypothetical protein
LTTYEVELPDLQGKALAVMGPMYRLVSDFRRYTEAFPGDEKGAVVDLPEKSYRVAQDYIVRIRGMYEKAPPEYQLHATLAWLVTRQLGVVWAANTAEEGLLIHIGCIEEYIVLFEVYGTNRALRHAASLAMAIHRLGEVIGEEKTLIRWRKVINKLTYYISVMREITDTETIPAFTQNGR